MMMTDLLLGLLPSSDSGLVSGPNYYNDCDDCDDDEDNDEDDDDGDDDDGIPMMMMLVTFPSSCETRSVEKERRIAFCRRR